MECGIHSESISPIQFHYLDNHFQILASFIFYHGFLYSWLCSFGITNHYRCSVHVPVTDICCQFLLVDVNVNEFIYKDNSVLTNEHNIHLLSNVLLLSPTDVRGSVWSPHDLVPKGADIQGVSPTGTHRPCVRLLLRSHSGDPVHRNDVPSVWDVLPHPSIHGTELVLR